MNRLRYIITGILFIAVSILATLSNHEFAIARISLNINGTAPVICDEAELFSEYEKVSLIDLANDLSKQTGYIYIIITTNEIKDYISGHELEGIYNDHRNELAGNGTVLFLINTNNNEKPCELQSYKSAAQTFSHDMCDYINSKAMVSIKTGAYLDGVKVVFDNLKAVTDGTLSEEQIAENDNATEKKYSKLISAIPYLAISLCIAYLIAAFSVYLIYKRSKSSYKKKFTQKSDSHSPDNIKKYRMYVRSVESTFSEK